MSALKIKYEAISYSYVAVWNDMLISLPQFGDGFNDLFGHAEKTMSGISNEGFVVLLQDSTFQPSVLIGPQKFVIIQRDIESLIKTYNYFIEKVRAYFDIKAIKVKSIGINVDYLASDENNENLQSVINRKFLVNAVKDTSPLVGFQDIQFRLVQDVSLSKYVTVAIRPALNAPTNVQFILNDHYGEVDHNFLFDSDQLQIQLLNTEGKFINEILPKLLNDDRE